MNDLLEQVSKERLVELLVKEQNEKKELEKILSAVQAKGNKTTERAMDNLHGDLATVMSAQATYQEEIVTFNAEGEAVPSGEQQYTASPALLGVIERFLKNNNILTDISTNENTATLQEAMGRKTKRSDRLPKGDKIVQLMEQEG